MFKYNFSAKNGPLVTHETLYKVNTFIIEFYQNYEAKKNFSALFTGSKVGMLQGRKLIRGKFLKWHKIAH